jgi:hypothetical protein
VKAGSYVAQQGVLGKDLKSRFLGFLAPSWYSWEVWEKVPNPEVLLFWFHVGPNVRMRIEPNFKLPVCQAFEIRTSSFCAKW